METNEFKKSNSFSFYHPNYPNSNCSQHQTDHRSTTLVEPRHIAYRFFYVHLLLLIDGIGAGEGAEAVAENGVADEDSVTPDQYKTTVLQPHTVGLPRVA